MLTVRFERLGVARGDLLLDLGAGGGRHAFEAARRGAFAVALDADLLPLKDAAAMLRALQAEDPALAETGGGGAASVGTALTLPFAENTFHRVIASEVLEHVADDRLALSELARVLRPGGTMAVTVPRWYPELVNWALSDDYHLRPGGHVRIYRRGTLEGRLAGAGLAVYGSHHAHALHTPYWWLRCALGVDDDRHPLVRAYHRLLVWDITAGHPLTRLPEAALAPLMGKSLVLYARKR